MSQPARLAEGDPANECPECNPHPKDRGESEQCRQHLRWQLARLDCRRPDRVHLAGDGDREADREPAEVARPGLARGELLIGHFGWNILRRRAQAQLRPADSKHAIAEWHVDDTVKPPTIDFDSVDAIE